ncbi:hypothetical protein V4S29_10655 [Enterococcus cecorum]|uniref:hypothetical protein n=1 Tax=Enterococcus cecorum TaxID=44008 RepID=UPI00326433A8
MIKLYIVAFTAVSLLGALTVYIDDCDKERTLKAENLKTTKLVYSILVGCVLLFL